MIKSSKGETYIEELNLVQELVFQNDLDFQRLEKQLTLLVDVIHEALQAVKKVTIVRAICEAMNTHAYKTLLSKVHKLLHLYFILPITFSTAERAFSSLRHLLTYLRSRMTEKRLNNCLLLDIHKDLTNSLDLKEIASDFVSANDERQRFFGSFALHEMYNV